MTPFHFHSPHRPRLPNGLPRHLEWNFALPSIQVTPVELPDSCWAYELRVWLPIEPTVAKQFLITTESVDEVLQSYTEDPEWTLLHHFGYSGMNRPGGFAKPTSDFSLSDIGL